MNSLFVAECGMNVHHKCEKKVANLCGVNQKLMAEALAMIGSKQQVRRSNPLLQMELVFFTEGGVSFPNCFNLGHFCKQRSLLRISWEVCFLLVVSVKVCQSSLGTRSFTKPFF